MDKVEQLIRSADQNDELVQLFKGVRKYEFDPLQDYSFADLTSTQATVHHGSDSDQASCKHLQAEPSIIHEDKGPLGETWLKPDEQWQKPTQESRNGKTS